MSISTLTSHFKGQPPLKYSEKWSFSKVSPKVSTHKLLWGRISLDLAMDHHSYTAALYLELLDPDSYLDTTSSASAG